MKLYQKMQKEIYCLQLLKIIQIQQIQAQIIYALLTMEHMRKKHMY